LTSPRIYFPRNLLVGYCLLLALLPGCHWNPFRRATVQSSPVAFVTGQPTLEELREAVNANTARVRSLNSQGATLRAPGAPAISGDIALERPLRFRFRAGTTFTGPEVDLGSNDELFWFWMARAPQPALFYARHAQYAASPVRQQIPVEPSWLIEGIGLTEINPGIVWDGPRPAGPDRVEVRGQIRTATGEMTKSLIIHNRFAWVLEQRLYDPQGQVVAQAIASQHDFSATDGVTLPKHIDVTLPAMQASFAIDVDRWQINSLPGDPQTLFALPREQLGTYPLVDLTAPPAGASPLVAPGANPNFAPVSVPAGVPAGPMGFPSAAAGQPQPRLSHVPDAVPAARMRGFR